MARTEGHRAHHALQRRLRLSLTLVLSPAPSKSSSLVACHEFLLLIVSADAVGARGNTVIDGAVSRLTRHIQMAPYMGCNANKPYLDKR